MRALSSSADSVVSVGGIEVADGVEQPGRREIGRAEAHRGERDLDATLGRTVSGFEQRRGEVAVTDDRRGPRQLEPRGRPVAVVQPLERSLVERRPSAPRASSIRPSSASRNVSATRIAGTSACDAA